MHARNQAPPCDQSGGEGTHASSHAAQVWDAKKAKQPPYLLKAITLILKSVFFMGCFLFMMPRFNMDKLFQEPYLSMPFWQK